MSGGAAVQYKPYPAYKPSGVEWLGDVPEHWRVGQLGHYSRVQSGLTLGKTYDRDDLVARPYLRVANVQDGFVDLAEVTEVRLPRSEVGRYELLAGDVLMTEGGDFDKLGRGCVWSGEVQGCLHQNHVFAVRPDSGRLLPAFLAALTASATGRHYFTSTSQQSTNLATTSRTKVKAFPILLPPLPEQRAIADFLDRETGRIGALIGKKRRLIELLEEKRSALISHAVTKGLDPDAPMKDSGIEWLGQIPAHWEVRKLSFLSRIGNGSTPSRENPLYWDDGDYPWLNSSVVNYRPVRAAEEFVTPLALRECHLPAVPPRSILVGITGQGKTRGMSTLLTYEATVNQHVAYITPHGRSATADFLCWELTAAYSILRDISDGAGSTKGALTCEQLGQFRLAIPPLSEQESIAGYLGQKLARLDVLVSKNREAIDKLQEYRTALVSAAVTGKVDVR